MLRLSAGFVLLALILFTSEAMSQPSASMSSQQPQWPTEILGKKIEIWANEIRDPDPSTRENAIRTIGMFGPSAKKAAGKYLVAAMDDKDTSCRVNAIIAVGTIGFEDSTLERQAVESLIRLLQFPQSIVRYQACMALGRIGQPAAAAINDLCTKSLVDPATWEIRRAAAFALGRVAAGSKDKPADRRAHVALARALKDDSSQVRREVVQSLLILGRPVNPADVEVLKGMIESHALKDKDRTVNIWSRVCLMRLEEAQLNDRNLQALVNLTKSKDLPAVVQATQALGVIGSDAKKHLPDLVALLDHEEPLCVITACWAIMQMGKDGSGALPRLNELVNSKDEAIKYAAEDAIDIVLGKRKLNEPRPMPVKAEPKLEVPKVPVVPKTN